MHPALAPGVSNFGAPSRSVEVFIVDTQSAAARALAGHRPTAESTHVLCRHADESAADFAKRVLERARRLQKSRNIRTIWYVVGPESTERASSLPLLESLLTTLDSGAGVTVVGPGSHQDVVFGWLDMLVPRHRHRVTLRAQLYPQLASGATAPSPPPRSAPRVSPGPVRSRAVGHEEEMLAESA